MNKKLLAIIVVLSGCAGLTPKNTNSIAEIQEYSKTLPNYKRYISEDFNSYNGDALIRSVLNKASLKSYNKSVIGQLNFKLFSNKLTTEEQGQLEKSFTNPLSKVYFEITAKLGKKYQRVLNKNLEDDDNYNGPSELNLYITNEVNKLFLIEEVQKELIETVFTESRKQVLFNYFKLIRNNILEKVTPKVDPNWSGQMNFYEVVKSTELFWPDMNYLKPFFSNKKINGKDVRIIGEEVGSNGKTMSEIYQRYFSQGFSFYTTSNASFGYFGYIDQHKQAMLVQPPFFAKIKGDLLSDFAIIGILAHELGHSAGYFSRKQFKDNFNRTDDEIQQFESRVLLPFYECYTAGKSNIDYARIQYQETRSDNIAYLVMKDFKQALNSSDDSLYLKMTDLFRQFTSEKFRTESDPHPFLEQRERIVSGQCQTEVIFPFTTYNDGM